MSGSVTRHPWGSASASVASASSVTVIVTPEMRVSEAPTVTQRATGVLELVRRPTEPIPTQLFGYRSNLDVRPGSETPIVHLLVTYA